MRVNLHQHRLGVVLILCIALLLPSQTLAFSGGIGGTQSNAGSDINDVAKEGCLCHSAAPIHSVTIIADDVPYLYVPSQTYDLTLQIIGGPDADDGSNTAGFSMRVSSGELNGGSDVQNFEDDVTTLTHEGATSAAERSWSITWTAPAEGGGVVFFWISGNSVDGDNINTNDEWNQLSFSLPEGVEDDSRTRTIFAGDGNIEPPAAKEGHLDLHDMGAPFRAHWLGLLGFNAVIMVIVFCGFMLRYGFSTSYEGRSNLLRLRYKQMRRGDQ